MQKIQDAGDGGALSSDPAEAPGLYESADRVTWERSDWLEPVGYLYQLDFEVFLFEWTASGFVRRHVPYETRIDLDVTIVSIPRLRLTHRAALLLLQGHGLSNILIPNHRLRADDDTEITKLVHMVVKVDPWSPYSPPPVLTNLKLAALNKVPPDVTPETVLATLVQQVL